MNEKPFLRGEPLQYTFGLLRSNLAYNLGRVPVELYSVLESKKCRMNKFQNKDLRGTKGA